MEQVNKRWKAYLKKCHPDRYANDPTKQADATRLTQELTRAHEKIKVAWEQYHGQRS
jgi:ribonuclease HI